MERAEQASEEGGRLLELLSVHWPPPGADHAPTSSGQEALRTVFAEIPGARVVRGQEPWGSAAQGALFSPGARALLADILG